MKKCNFLYVFAALMLLSFGVVLAVGGCSSSEGDTESLPTLKVLTVGQLDSSLYTDLQNETGDFILEFTPYTESIDITGYDLLVFDGNSLTSDDIIAGDGLIRDALDKGLNILFVDLQSSQTAEIQQLTGLVLEGDYKGVLLDQEATEYGHTHIKAMLFPYDEEDESSFLVSDARTIVDYLINGSSLDFGSDKSGKVKSSSKENSDYPIDNPPIFAIYKSYSIYQKVHNLIQVANGTGDEMVGITFRSDAYFDTISNTYKVFFNQTGIVYMDSAHNLYEKGFDKYLFQSDFFMDISTDNNQANVVDFTPKNVNNQTSYTESMSATIGGKVSASEERIGGGGSGSFQVGFSKTRTIKDWSIQNTSSSDSSCNWRFYQTNRRNQFYEDLPDWSRLNFNLYNTSLWEFPTATQTVTFKCSGTRKFGKAGKRIWGAFPIGEIEAVTDSKFDFKNISITLPSH